MLQVSFNHRSGHSYIKRMYTQRRAIVPMFGHWEGARQNSGHYKLIAFHTTLKRTVIEISARIRDDPRKIKLHSCSDME